MRAIPQTLVPALEGNMDSARYESLCGASVRGVCVCLRQCGSVTACGSSMYACVSVSPLYVNNRGVPRESGTSAGKFGKALFCVPKRECIANGLVTRNHFCIGKYLGEKGGCSPL